MVVTGNNLYIMHVMMSCGFVFAKEEEGEQQRHMRQTCATTVLRGSAIHDDSLGDGEQVSTLCSRHRSFMFPL